MDPIQALLLQADQKKTDFPPTSRYAATETSILQLPGKDPILYLKRRLIPPPESFADLYKHVIQQGDRLDNITHKYIGDSEQFWQICDANRTMHPLELTEESNKTIRITLPRGIPGNPNA